MPVQLAATEYGTGPPVAILHGLFGSGRNWRSIAQQLSTREFGKTARAGGRRRGAQAIVAQPVGVERVVRAEQRRREKQGGNKGRERLGGWHARAVSGALRGCRGSKGEDRAAKVTAT